MKKNKTLLKTLSVYMLLASFTATKNNNPMYVWYTASCIQNLILENNPIDEKIQLKLKAELQAITNHQDLPRYLHYILTTNLFNYALSITNHLKNKFDMQINNDSNQEIEIKNLQAEILKYCKETFNVVKFQTFLRDFSLILPSLQEEQINLKNFLEKTEKINNLLMENSIHLEIRKLQNSFFIIKELIQQIQLIDEFIGEIRKKYQINDLLEQFILKRGLFYLIYKI